jgi:hypothetical protein
MVWRGLSLCSCASLLAMQRKEDRKLSRLSKKRRRRKGLEANKEKESNNPFTFWMNSWYDYVNAIVCMLNILKI